MGKSSIHIQPVKPGSEDHNQRLKELHYIRKELSHLNSEVIEETIGSALERIKFNVKEKTGRSMQDKASPIREAVLLISPNTTASELMHLGRKLHKRFGIKPIQAYAHHDEGHHKSKKEWKPNHHGHIVFDWMNDQTGKSIKLNREDMVEMQTIVADELNLERGVSSEKKHLNAIQYKVLQEEKRLDKAQTVLKNQKRPKKGILGTINTLSNLSHLKDALSLSESKNEALNENNSKLNELKVKHQNEIDQLMQAQQEHLRRLSQIKELEFKLNRQELELEEKLKQNKELKEAISKLNFGPENGQATVRKINGKLAIISEKQAQEIEKKHLKKEQEQKQQNRNRGFRR